jgi:sugar lactone lactonase YvrE
VAQGRSANGIALSPDEKRLYALQGGIWDLDPAGVPANQRSLSVGGDGMAVDCAGNVYASGQIISAQGQRLGSYPGGTNLTFGGRDGRTLLVVGGGTRVRAVAMNVPGLP